MNTNRSFSVLSAVLAGLAARNACGDIYTIGPGTTLCQGLVLELTSVPACGIYQDPRYDYILIRERPMPALPTHTSISIAVSFPDCFVPIIEATYINDGGVVPSRIQVHSELAAECSQDPTGRFYYAQFEFDPAVTIGRASAVLMLTIPKGHLIGTALAALRANDPAPTPNSDFTTCFVFIASEGCPADFNCDGPIDLFDYLDFVGVFESATGRSDFNRDGSVDLFDYLDFVEALNAGC